MLHYVHTLKEGRLEKMVGLFVLYAAGLLASAILILGVQQFLFGRFQVRTTFDHGYGLKQGMPVNLIGLEVGKVDSVHLNDENRIDVTMSIKKKYKDRIKKNSTARIVSLDLMGHTALEIAMAPFDGPSVEEGDILDNASLAQHEEKSGEAFPVLARADEVMSNVNEFIKDLSPSLKKMNTIMERLDTVSAEISEGKGNIGALVKNDNLYQQFSALIDKTQRTMDRVDAATKDIQKVSGKIPGIVESGQESIVDIRKSVDKIPELMQGWKTLIGNINKSAEKMYFLLAEGGNQITSISEILGDIKDVSKKMPDMARATQENIDEISRIIEGAEKNWIIKGFIEREKTEKPILLDARDHHYKGKIHVEADSKLIN